MNNLKQKILWILSEDEQSRNSDIRLTQMIWYKFYNSKIINLDDGTKAVRLRDLFDLPREDNIKRVRAKIQNEEGKFLPTSAEVRKQRKIKEWKWREQMSPSNPAMG
jgi:hypothetical protein